MPLDGLFYRHLVNELSVELGYARVNKFIEVSDTSFLLNLRQEKNNKKLIISLNPSSKRICLTTKPYQALEINNPFFRLLKKHLEGAIIKSISQYKCDRVILLHLITFNTFKDKVSETLVLEFTRSNNIVLLDSNNLIIDCLYKTTFESNRLIVKNAYFVFEENNKLDPFISSSFTPNFQKEYDGISLVLFDYLKENPNLLPTILSTVKPSLFTNSFGNLDFYSYPLAAYYTLFSSLSLLLEAFYYDHDRLIQIKKETNHIDKVLKRYISKLEKKITKITEDIKETSNYEDLKLKADLLYCYPNLKEHLSNVTLFNFYTNQNIELELDGRFNVLTNANKLYQKASKLKKSLPYLEEQLTLAKNDLSYYKDLYGQLNYLTVADIIDLKLELNLGSEKRNIKKKKPNIIKYQLPSGALVLVGRNNTQNNYLTHTVAIDSDLWFHVLNSPGSHVILRNSNFSEEDIRLAASIAAYYSSQRLSSSIPVTYTLKRYVKKMSGFKGSFVKYSNEKTIYIDISEDVISNLEQV